MSAATGVHAALASPIRRHLLQLLQTADAARDVHDLGRAMGLHPSTVRFHLETLRQAGLVTRERDRHPTVGRPRTVYGCVTPADGDATYADLTRLFAAGLAEFAEDRAARAEVLGGRWAEQVVPVAAERGAGPEEATRKVSQLFDRLGFDPELRSQGPTWQLALHACPFRAVARAYPEAVCAAHLGLLRGSVERLGASATARLLPFVEPELCLVEVTNSPG
ncbi:MAG: ArsR family transcriptional regulator [Nostocoides sp.]